MPNEPAIAFSSKQVGDLEIPHQVRVNAFTGSADISVSFATTPTRGGFHPTLSLMYSSSGRNSAFGVGWGLSGVLAVGLSVRDGLPRYNETSKFSFGGQDLVPWREGRESESLLRDEHRVEYFRSEVQGPFQRFEKWTHQTTGQIHWRVRDRSNIVSIFGADSDGLTRIFNPENDKQVFQWLLEAQYDQHENAIFYEWFKENEANIDQGSSFEWYRATTSPHATQRYLKRIKYGNRTPLSLHDPPGDDWLFELVLDYGDHPDDGVPVYEPAATDWPARPDPFSSYQAGFEIRTYRLCRGVLQFHRFPELGEDPTLVGAWRLDHQLDQAGSTLNQIRYTGYRRDRETSQYTSRALPPLVFRYSEARMGEEISAPPRETEVNAPHGLSGLNYRWVDLYCEGLPGILFEGRDAWYFKRNLGDGRLDVQEVVVEKPTALQGEYALSDFDGDGNLDLVVLQGRESGYYEYDRDAARWGGFRSFTDCPHIGASLGSTQLLDLNGDGRTDIVDVKDDRLAWYPSHGKSGFASAIEITRPRTKGLSQAPTIGVRPNLDLFFADVSGDGLPDQVQVLNGRVEYWPQLGHGRFGPGIVMENAPVLDFDGAFDASRVRLVDLDGSGTADLLYLGRGEIRYWINGSGNRFSEGAVLRSLPYIDNLTSVQVLDFLGDGTPCLVWASQMPGRAGARIQYLRLTDGIKPRLLTSIENSMGRETRVTYGYSASHYLRDRRDGHPWISRLPRHMTVVDRVEIIDHIGKTSAQTRYAYHDGYFDSIERQHRGFALVDQYDTESYQGSPDEDPIRHGKPLCTRTWYHNGAPGWGDRRRQAYYAGDRKAPSLPPEVVGDVETLSEDAYLLAYRSLVGSVVRSETYGFDETGQRGEHPYSIAALSYRVRRVQAEHHGTGAAMHVYDEQTLELIYEQDPSDPRISHSIKLRVDAYGNLRESCSIGYPRRGGTAPRVEAQADPLIGVATTEVINIDEGERYLLGVPSESRTYEIWGVRPPPDGIFDLTWLRSEIEAAVTAAIPFDAEFQITEEDERPPPAQARLQQWDRIRYWDDARRGALPPGEIGTLPLVHHSESACFPESFVDDVYGGRVDPALLRSEGRYHLDGAYWWRRGSTQHYTPPERFNILAREEYQDETGELHDLATYVYDEHALTLVGVTDAAGNRVRAALEDEVTPTIDYHVLAPDRIVDPNGNVSEVAYDALGMVAISTHHGEVLGSDDTTLRGYGHQHIADYQPETDHEFERIAAEPERFVQGAAQFFHYELDRWAEVGRPPRAITVTRETLVHDGENGPPTDNPCQVSVLYLDGFGRALQTKDRVEPEPERRDDVLWTWRASGRTVYNNKQEVVRQYEPYFTDVLEFRPDEDERTSGMTADRFYDPLGRLELMMLPNGTSSRTEYSAWQSRAFDPNDAIEGTPYAAVAGAITDENDPKKQAFVKAWAHRDTPVTTHLDPAGRAVVVEELDRSGPPRRTITKLDHQGAPREIVDPRELPAFTYQRDMLGRVLHEHSIDAGDKWAFPDALDLPRHTWNGAGIHQWLELDRLGRPTAIHVEGDDAGPRVTERLFYGDDPSLPDATRRNQRGRLVRHFDPAGLVTVEAYDPHGAPLRNSRRLLADAKAEADWTRLEPDRLEPEAERFPSRTLYDALGRPAERHLPDGTTRAFHYLPSGGISQFLVTTDDGGLIDQPILQEATYNARGQRIASRLGNGVETTFSYDEQTHRLSHLFSKRNGTAGAADRVYQDIRYTYDPVGNITRLVDAAQSSREDVIRGLGVSAESDFTYDAFYQLTQASGRVHEALLPHDYERRANGQAPSWIKGTRHLSLNDGAGVRRCMRRYSYDPSGNLRSINHRTLDLGGNTSRDWTSEIWVSSSSNRGLPATDSNDVPVTDPETRFDPSGNCRYLPHLRRLDWSYRNTLSRAVIIDRSAEGHPDDAEYYVYGGDGLRVRKITEQLTGGDGLRVTEKTYLDGCEIKRISLNGRRILERKSSHLSDGSQRLAVIHRWSIDANGLETNDLRSTRIHYQLGNHLGSASLELAESGRVISYEEYFPFGGTAFIAGDDVREIRRKDYRYTGKERDDATGFYYFGYRYLVAWMGRWLSPDPIGPADGLNLYQFVSNNPTCRTDPNGLYIEGRLGEDEYQDDFVIRMSRSEIEARAFSSEEQAHLIQGGAVIWGTYLGESVNLDFRRSIETPGLVEFLERNRSAEMNIFVYDPTLDEVNFEQDERVVAQRPEQGPPAPEPAPQEASSEVEGIVGAVSEDAFQRLIRDLASEQDGRDEILSRFYEPDEPQREEPDGDAQTAQFLDDWLPQSASESEIPDIPNVCVQSCHTSYPSTGYIPAELAGLLVIGLGVLLVVGGLALAAPTAGGGVFAAIEGTMMIAGGVAMVGAGGSVFILHATGAVDNEKAFEAYDAISRAGGLSHPVVLPLAAGGLAAEGFGAPEGTGEAAEALGHGINLARGGAHLGRGLLRRGGYAGDRDAFRSWSRSPADRRLMAEWEALLAAEGPPLPPGAAHIDLRGRGWRVDRLERLMSSGDARWMPTDEELLIAWAEAFRSESTLGAAGNYANQRQRNTVKALLEGLEIHHMRYPSWRYPDQADDPFQMYAAGRPAHEELHRIFGWTGRWPGPKPRLRMWSRMEWGEERELQYMMEFLAPHSEIRGSVVPMIEAHAGRVDNMTASGRARLESYRLRPRR